MKLILIIILLCTAVIVSGCAHRIDRVISQESVQMIIKAEFSDITASQRLPSENELNIGVLRVNEIGKDNLMNRQVFKNDQTDYSGPGFSLVQEVSDNGILIYSASKMGQSFRVSLGNVKIIVTNKCLYVSADDYQVKEYIINLLSQ
jgi:hypothetical protein